MHGNEVVGREVLIHLLEYMLTNQKRDADVDFIMKNTRLHVMPSMNPDGFERAKVKDCSSINGRTNSNGYDLNRNFPDYFENNSAALQPETRAIMKWLETNDFLLSANAHGGSLVVNYPFDNYRNSTDKPVNSTTDDNDVFLTMALKYASLNPSMIAPQVCTEDEPSFINGTTNGG